MAHATCPKCGSEMIGLSCKDFGHRSTADELKQGQQKQASTDQQTEADQSDPYRNRSVTEQMFMGQ